MIIFCDIDHCLTDAYWRDDLIGTYDGQDNWQGWEAYHAAAINDPPALDTIALVNALSDSHRIVGLTSRPEKWREQTMRWLVQHEVEMDQLLMRPDTDHRRSPELKTALALAKFHGAQELLRQHTRVVIDDREDVLAAFRQLSVPTMQISIRRR